jgi:TonB family protein
MKKNHYLALFFIWFFCLSSAFAQTIPKLSSQTNCAKPEYPSASSRLEEEGTVSLRFVVGADGNVIESYVENSSGFRRLDEAARSAISKCQFTPSIKDGVPVEGVARMKFTFKLNTPGIIIPPAVYKVSDLNNVILKDDKYLKLRFFGFASPDNLSISCRLSNKPIYVSSSQMPINKFIEEAFNAELKAANLFADQGVLITADIKRIDVSTILNGSWNIELELRFESGRKVSVSHSLSFPVATNAEASCAKAAQEFPVFVQQLFYKMVMGSNLVEMLK